jgi:tetratricopeptide (TPR) repeat protein
VPLQSSIFETRFNDFLMRFAVFMVLVGLSIAAAVAQQPNRFEIRGTVLDSSGKPVADALVQLVQKGSPDILATTNSEGVFIFTALQAGSYLMHAEKAGLHSQVSAVAVSLQTVEGNTNLVLEATANTSSPEAMAFADKPDFTVAGITDWTAAGGHGSDVSLRTSEALARETATLKPANHDDSTSSSGESEAALRAALAQAPKSFEANHQLGEFCLRKGSYREAVPLLETAYQIDPANYGNEYDLALAYKAAGDFTRAHEHIQKLLTHDNHADLHRLAGDVDEEMGDSLLAVREYEQAVRLDPSEQNYFAWGSELLLHRAVWPAAEVFKKGVEAHPKSARMLAALGAALFASAQYDEAALRLCDASDLNPTDPAPYIFLGKIDIVAPAPLDCVEPRLKRFAQQQPEDARANYYYAMAIWKRQPEAVQQVEALLNKAAADDPKYDEAYLQLGNLYFSEHNPDKAIAFYTKAIEVNPQLGEAHYRLGVAFERTGESAKAKHEFQLHDEIEKQQAAAVERQRREIKQFLVVLQGQPVVH